MSVRDGGIVELNVVEGGNERSGDKIVIIFSAGRGGINTCSCVFHLVIIEVQRIHKAQAAGGVGPVSGDADGIRHVLAGALEVNLEGGGHGQRFAQLAVPTADPPLTTGGRFGKLAGRQNGGGGDWSRLRFLFLAVDGASGNG